MKHLIIFSLLFINFIVKAQTYTIDKIVSNTNGFTGPMTGVPGDLFSSTITFSNTSNNDIILFMNRYKNNIPPYWGDCYCYLNCHNVYQDTISVFIQPHATADVSIQFKTDSVNPGIAKVGFSVYQIGFQNNVQDIQMTASTINNVGLPQNTLQNAPMVFPNPTQNALNISSGESIQSIILYNMLGELQNEYKNIEAGTFNLNMAEFANGLYLLEVTSGQKTFTQNIIKN